MIIVIDDGYIVARGTHRDLLKCCPVCSKMWSLHSPDSRLAKCVYTIHQDDPVY